MRRPGPAPGACAGAGPVPAAAATPAVVHPVPKTFRNKERTS